MGIDLESIYRRREAESRSISAENPTGERGKGAMARPEGEGAARELGRGWKVRPCLRNVSPGETVTIMDVDGPGVIRHMWFTFKEDFYRDVIIRVYWDGQKSPSVQAPLGDLMCNSWDCRQDILAGPINVNPEGGMNIYFPMPFRENARITIENDSPNELPAFFYTINYTLEPVEDDALYFSNSPGRRRKLRMLKFTRSHQAYLLDAFTAALDDRVEPETSGRHNLNSLVATHAWVRAVRQGRRVSVRDVLR